MPKFIPVKQRILLTCLQRRAAADYIHETNPFVYEPESEWSPPEIHGDDPEINYRIPHLEL